MMPATNLLGHMSTLGTALVGTPASPSLTATAVSSTQINLSWNSVFGAQGYLVDEWVNGAWKQIGNFGNGTTSCAVNNLSPGTTYYFDVGAYDWTGVSWANFASATTYQAGPPAAPSFTLTVVSSTQINMAWNSVAGATGYLVDIWMNGAWKQIGNFGSGSTHCSVTGLAPGTTYYLDLAAYNSSGTSWAHYQSATTTNGGGGGGTTIDHPAANGAYSPVNGSLFGPNGPSFRDVRQGAVGDCWLESSLAEVAARMPQVIRSMFTYVGTAVEHGYTVGLYKVRFYDNYGTAHYVVVDTELPNGGNMYDHPVNGVLWVALAEKAYAEANGQRFVTTMHPGLDSYSALDAGDPAWALRAITGRPAGEYAINPSNIAAAWNAGKLIVLGTGSSTSSTYIVPGHAYAVVGYNPASTTPFMVFNPWGTGMANFNGHPVYGLFNSNGAFIGHNFVMQFVGSGAEHDLRITLPAACAGADVILLLTEESVSRSERIPAVAETPVVESGARRAELETRFAELSLDEPAGAPSLACLDDGYFPAAGLDVSLSAGMISVAPDVLISIE